MKNVRLAQGLEEIVIVANRESLLTKSKFEEVAKKVAPEFEFTGDDWINDFYPSETASIALTERDSDGNIIRTGIAALYADFPIIIADSTGCYIYKDNRIISVIAIDRTLVENIKIPIRFHIFAQKSTPHWAWMNEIIGFLIREEIRTCNNMGPYFLIRNFFYYYQEIKEGIKIKPMKVVLSEPYINRPKNEIIAFIIKMLNQKLSVNEQIFISDMSGGELFDDGKIKKIVDCEIYCTFGWIAGASKGDVFSVLSRMKNAVSVLGKPKDTNRKIEQLVSDLNNFQA